MVTESRPVATAPDHTAWARHLETPLRRFLATQTGSAAVLLGATIVALAWANLSPASYQAVWHTPLSIRLGGAGESLDLIEKERCTALYTMPGMTTSMLTHKDFRRERTRTLRKGVTICTPG